MSSEFIPFAQRFAGLGRRPQPARKMRHQRVQYADTKMPPGVIAMPSAKKLTERILAMQADLTLKAQDAIDIPLGEWLPDLPSLNNPGVVILENVLPALIGYKQAPGLVVFSNALSARCQGAIAFLDSNETIYMFAGDVSKLYDLTAQTWTDRSKGGGYAIGGDDQWEFVRWGDQVFATNIVDPIQEATMGSYPFADLITSTAKPKAKHMAAVRDFLVLGNENIGGPDSIYWSAFNDPLDFDIAQATQCDRRTLRSSTGGGGRVQKIVGREYGIVFQESSIWRMSYVGTPTVWDTDEIETDLGAFASGSVTPFARRIFFLAEDGFRETNGLTSKRIGQNKIDRTFWNDLDGSNRDRIVSVVDPLNSLVMWAYPGVGNTNGRPNKILAYNYTTGHWAPIVSLEVDEIFQAITVGFTLEGLDVPSGSDIDSMVISLDSRVWAGGLTQLAAFKSDFKTYTFEETSPLDAVFEVGDQQLYGGNHHARLTSVRPRVTGNASTVVTVKVGTRDKLHGDGSTIAYTSYRAVDANEEADFRDDNLYARYHRPNIKITGGFEDATHMTVDAVPKGRK